MQMTRKHAVTCCGLISYNMHASLDINSCACFDSLIIQHQTVTVCIERNDRHVLGDDVFLSELQHACLLSCKPKML